MAIRRYDCFKKGRNLYVQNALDAVEVNGRYIGWFTQVGFRNWYSVTKLSITCESWTTFCLKGKNGWRRIIHNHPWCKTDMTYVAYPPNSERLEPGQFGHGKRVDNWRWTDDSRGQRQASYFYRDTHLSAPTFNVSELLALVHGVGQDLSGGYALFDFVQDTTEFGGLLSGPQWLPRTWMEMVEAAATADRERAEKRAAALAEPLDLPDTPEEEDRWR